MIAAKIDRRFGFILAILTLACGLVCPGLRAEAGHCDICGKPLNGPLYTVTDNVTGEKKQICYECSILPTTCFVCGLPVRTNGTELPDGRVLCARDARTAVLDEDAARRICLDTRDAMDRLFSRFLSFPETNVTVAVIDRVHLQDLFKFAGHDYVCPNVWGYVETRTNHGHFAHSMSLLSGLPLGSFKATCAHEFTHTWLNENLSARRKRTLSRDANEGFCELISYLLMDSLGAEPEKRQILRNAYTRGQIHVFVATEKRYGLEDIVDWMKSGADARLNADDLGRVRVVETAPPGVELTPIYPAYQPPPPAPSPDALVLKAITWTQDHPLALINDRTFAVNDEHLVRLGETNVAIRCLAIREDSVRIRITGSGEERELRFSDDPNR